MAKLSVEIETIIQHIFTYKFPSEEQLVEFANARHGFGGDDGSYGVTYPDDLDQYDREVSSHEIPEGSVEIYCSAYNDSDIIVTEKLYLKELKSYLNSKEKYYLATNLKNT